MLKGLSDKILNILVNEEFIKKGNGRSLKIKSEKSTFNQLLFHHKKYRFNTFWLIVVYFQVRDLYLEHDFSECCVLDMAFLR